MIKEQGVIHSDSDDDSHYFDTDEESVTGADGHLYDGPLQTMDVKTSSSRRNRNPYIINDEFNADILDSFGWNYSGFLEWLPLEKIRSWLTWRNFLYALILVGLKVGIFLVFGYILFGTGDDVMESKDDMSFETNRYFTTKPWPDTFRKTDELRQLLRITSQHSKESSALMSTPISWKYQVDILEFIICTPKEEDMLMVKSSVSSSSPAKDPLALEAIHRDLVVHRFANTEFEELFGYTMVLNKFNTIKDHALILTDKFVPQINPITVTEFALWYWSIYQVNGVGFYNSNKIAGASQLHRHLQLIPMDVIAGMRNVDAVYPLPLDDLVMPQIESSRWKPLPFDNTVEMDDFVYHLPQFTFKHGFFVLDPKKSRNISLNDFALKNYAEYLENAYRHLLKVMGIDERIPIHCAFNKDNPLCAESGEYLIRSSYNVILTTNYLMVVPRSVPNAGLNINAMGFLGLLLSHAPTKNDILENQGPYAVLQAVGKPS